MSSSLSASASAASSILLHTLLVLTTLLLLAAATVSVSTTAFVPVDDDMNTTMFTNNGSSMTTTMTTLSAENWEMYYCFLCTEQHPLLIHYCPIYWDECHLNCWDVVPHEAPPSSTCDGIASCFFTCGGGELDNQKGAMATTVPATTIQGSFVPFELCNTELVFSPPFIAAGARH
ncbi:Unknown protein [Striga hermonthica]|uniref:Membrane-associated protein n=1 Tax=Striga hermonthica TaxID=68872 RepID=A0A9N7NT84_STRHE|nr:Unknown protein [Striga hermonthica]